MWHLNFQFSIFAGKKGEKMKIEVKCLGAWTKREDKVCMTLRFPFTTETTNLQRPMLEYRNLYC